MPRRNSTTRRLAAAPAEFPDFGRFHAEIRVRGERLCNEAGVTSPPSLEERVSRSIRALKIRREKCRDLRSPERASLSKAIAQLHEVDAVLKAVRSYSRSRFADPR